jgi:hypothetical protein
VIDSVSRGVLESMRPSIEAAKADMTWEGLAERLLCLLSTTPARDPTAASGGHKGTVNGA